jgi:hypothetical protein
VSLGALLVHLSCPALGGWHWLIAHALAPIASAVPVGLLAARALRYLGRRPLLETSRLLDA